MAKFSKFLLSNLELILAGMSIPVIAAVHLLISLRFDHPWEITAVAAVNVGVLHGILGWLVRARQRSVRLELLQRMAAILQRDPEVFHASVESEPKPMSDYALRLALAQLPALVREPLVIKTVDHPELSTLRGHSA